MQGHICDKIAMPDWAPMTIQTRHIAEIRIFCLFCVQSGFEGAYLWRNTNAWLDTHDCSKNLHKVRRASAKKKMPIIRAITNRIVRKELCAGALLFTMMTTILIACSLPCWNMSTGRCVSTFFIYDDDDIFYLRSVSSTPMTAVFSSWWSWLNFIVLRLRKTSCSWETILISLRVIDMS